MQTAVASKIPTQMYIEGAWCDGAAGKTLAVINPADESVVAEVAYGSTADAERAIDAAARAAAAWRALSAYDRGKILKKTADLMRDRVETIGRTLTQEQGKPLAEAKMEVMHAADTFEWFAEEGKRTYGRIIPPANVQKRYYAIKHPVGVVCSITPWNFPAALPSRKIAAALAAGCTVGEPAGRPDAADLDPDVRLPGRRRPAAGRGQPGDRALAGARRRLLRIPWCARSASRAQPRSAKS